MIRHLAITILALSFAFSHANAQEGATPHQQKLRVLVKPTEPFTFERDGEIVGFSIDLWKRIAEEAGLSFEITMLKTLPEVLTAVEKGEADIGVGAISITPAREKILDFTHPFFDSGLQIMTRGDGNASSRAAYQALFRGDVAKVVGVLLIAILLVSHLLWLFERKRNQESFPGGYRAGVWESAWWAICTIISGGCENKSAVTIAGRLVAIAWMIGGIFLTSFITATLASAMTINKLSSNINGIADLKGQAIAAITGSTAEIYLKEKGFSPAGQSDLASAIDLLKAGNAKAVVYDSPMLRYYISRNAGDALKLAGDLFERQGYGFALTLGSPHRKAINEAILKLQTEGFTAALERKWFSGVVD